MRVFIRYSVGLGVYNQCIYRNTHRERGPKCETDYDLMCDWEGIRDGVFNGPGCV